MLRESSRNERETGQWTHINGQTDRRILFCQVNIQTLTLSLIFSSQNLKMSKQWGAAPVCPACKKSVYPLESVFAADRKRFHRDCLQCKAKGCRHRTGGRWREVIAGCYFQLQSDREGSPQAPGRLQHLQQVLRLSLQAPGELQAPSCLVGLTEFSLQEFLAEGEETPSERRARLAREAEERDRRRQAGEDERIKLEMAEREEFNFSFLKVAEIVGIAPESSICL